MACPQQAEHAPSAAAQPPARAFGMRSTWALAPGPAPATATWSSCSATRRRTSRRLGSSGDLLGGQEGGGRRWWGGGVSWGCHVEEGHGRDELRQLSACRDALAQWQQAHRAAHRSTTSSPRRNLKNRMLNLSTSTAIKPVSPPPPLLPPLLLGSGSSASGTNFTDATQSFNIHATPSHSQRGPDDFILVRGPAGCCGQSERCAAPAPASRMV